MLFKWQRGEIWSLLEKSVFEEGWKQSLISKLRCSPKGSITAAVQQLPLFPKQPLRVRACGICTGWQGRSPSPPTTASKPSLLAPRPLRDTAGWISAFPEGLHFPAKLCRCNACRGLGAFPLDGVGGEIETSAVLHREKESNSCLLEWVVGLQVRQCVGSCAGGIPLHPVCHVELFMEKQGQLSPQEVMNASRPPPWRDARLQPRY